MAHFSRIGRLSKAGRRLAQYRAPQLADEATGEVDAINGAFMLVRTAALHSVGLLDDRYWLYAEDLDWCYRFHQAGWKVLYDGTVTIVHLKAGTSGKHRRLRQNIAFHRGMARFYGKYYAGSNVLADAAVFGGIYSKLTASVVRSAVVRGLLRTIRIIRGT